MEILLSPFTFIIENIFQFSYWLTENYGVSVLMLSFIITLCLIPIYRWSEKLKNKNLVQKGKMKPYLDEIKRNYSGQERYYYTRATYRIFKYKTWKDLISAIDLFVQLPFLIAAYFYLDNYAPFIGESFLAIKDLSLPDGLLGNINVLPILMTLVNLSSAFFFLQNAERSEKIQIYTISGLFLILLYNSSSALLLYWTLNNVFSLVKNGMTSKSSISDVKLAFTNLFKYSRALIQICLFLTFYSALIYLFNDADTFTSSWAFNLSLLFITLAAIVLFLNYWRSRFDTQRTKALSAFLIVFLMVIVFIDIQYVNEYSRFTLLSFFTIPAIKELVIILPIVFCLFFFFFNKKILVLKKEAFSLQELLLVLLPISALITYIGPNLEYFSQWNTVLYFLLLIGIPTTIYIIIRLTFNRYLNNTLALGLFVSSMFTYYMMPMFTNILKMRAEENVFYHFAILIAITSIGCIIVTKKRLAQILSVTLFLVAVINFLWSKQPAVGAVENTENQTSTELSELETYLYSKKDSIKRKPDIYFLIYDAYVQDKQMAMYDIDNSAQEQWLKDKGFTFYENSYTAAPASRSSISRVFDMGKSASINTSETTKLIAGNSTLDDFLQSESYKTHYVLSEYMLGGNHEFGGDFAFPQIKRNRGINRIFVMVKSILLGQFKFTAGVLLDKSTREEWMDTKRAVMKSTPDYPKFVYTHTGPGHSQNSGKCLPNEIDLFDERLKKANAEMKVDIKSCLSSNREAIIIVAGDHGPYLRGDCWMLKGYEESEISSDLIIDRYGIFQAIKWPDDTHIQYDHKLDLLQNVFFPILAYMYEDNAINDLRLKRETIENIHNKTFKQGTITNGVIQIGPDKGKKLYDGL